MNFIIKLLTLSMKENFIISKASFITTFPSCEVELSCIVGAVSSLLLSLLPPPIPSLPISVARLALLDIMIPEVLDDILLFE